MASASTTADELRNLAHEAQAHGVAEADVVAARQAAAVRIEKELKAMMDSGLAADKHADYFARLTERAEGEGASAAFVEQVRAISVSQREKDFKRNVQEALADKDPDRVIAHVQEAEAYGLTATEIENARSAAKALHLVAFKDSLGVEEDSDGLIGLVNDAEEKGLSQTDIEVARSKAKGQATSWMQTVLADAGMTEDDNSVREAIERAERATVSEMTISPARQKLQQLAAAEITQAMKEADENTDVPIIQAPQLHRLIHAVERAQKDGVESLRLAPAQKARSEKLSAAITDGQTRKDMRVTWEALNYARAYASADLKDTISTAERRLRGEVNETLHAAQSVATSDRQRLRAAVDIGYQPGTSDGYEPTAEEHQAHEAAIEILGMEEHRDAIRQGMRDSVEAQDWAGLLNNVREGSRVLVPEVELAPFAEQAKREVTAAVQRASNDTVDINEARAAVELALNAKLDEMVIAPARNRLAQEARAQVAAAGEDLEALHRASVQPYLPEADKASAQMTLKTKLLLQLDTWAMKPDSSGLRKYVDLLNLATDGRVPDVPEASLAKWRAAFRSELSKEVAAVVQGASVDTLPRFDQVIDTIDAGHHLWTFAEDDVTRKEVQELEKAIDNARNLHGQEHAKYNWLAHLEASLGDNNLDSTREGLREAKASGCSQMQLQRFEADLATRDAALQAAKVKVTAALASRSLEQMQEALRQAENTGVEFEDRDVMENTRTAIGEEQEKRGALEELTDMSTHVQRLIERAQRAGVPQAEILKVLPTVAAATPAV